MKKTLIALAAIGAMTGFAHAQSSVTLYGLVDADVQAYKTSTVVGTTVQPLTQRRIETDGLNGNRWGMRIREDLGGGLAAIANLESGFAIDTGASAQGGLLFGRRANVGLNGGFGTVTIGRNSSSYDDVSADHAMMAQTIFDPSNTNNGFSLAQVTAAGSAASAAALLNHAGRTWVGYGTRFNNSVKYISPTFGGFSGSVMYAFGEDKTTTVNASKSISANLKYANGPLTVSGGYQSEQTANTNVGIANPNTATGKPALENTLLNVAYDFGVAKVGAGFNRAKYKDVVVPVYLGGNGTATYAAQKEVSLSVAVPIGAATISADYAQSKGDTLGKSTGFGVQALYSLSKRTTLYVGGLSTKAYDNVAARTVVLLPGSNVSRSTIVAAGVRHTF
jgi:predicted porin